MKTLGVLMLAAAATGTGGMFDGPGKPHALTSLFRPHVVRYGPPPASGPIMAPPTDPALSGAGFGANRMFANTTSQVFFVDPANMEISWQTAGPDGSPVYLPPQLTVPARYNFRQGFIYRLKLTNIANNPGLSLYPTIEVAPSSPQTDAYLTHNPIPVQFTQEDFDQVRAGNFVTKVVYLPDPKFQELAVAGLYGAETLVSTRLEPGVDPILEADKRGTILMVIRVGAIDLEMPPGGSGSVAAPAADGYAPGEVIYGEPGTMTPPPSPELNTIAPPVEEVPVEGSSPSTFIPPVAEPSVAPVSMPVPPLPQTGSPSPFTGSLPELP
ncbi:hypothetical protein [Tautonia marina]|uniref:hypothetical protein n=1 Tax=Tautonia marina TaxID=2653855 RepID=UPI001260C7FE|nr:hypothetical protein [Tautonia marina]